MAKLTTTSITDGDHATEMNSNLTAIETAVENTLSRDGTAPNQMNADFDLNSNFVLNMPPGTDPTHPLQKQQIENAIAIGGGTAVLNDILDVDVTAASQFDMLYYDGTDWVDTGGDLQWDGTNLTFNNGAQSVDVGVDGSDFNINLGTSTNLDIRGGTRVLVNDMNLRLDARGSGSAHSLDVLYDDAAERICFEITRETGAADVFRISATAVGDVKFIDPQDTNSIYMQFVTGSDVRIRDGHTFRIYDGGDTDYAEFSHDGNNFLTAFTTTNNWDITGINRFRMNGSNVSLALQEDSVVGADVPGYGQFWVRDDVPNVPMFTDDAGTDFVLNESGVADGTTTDATLHWSGSAWVENNAVLITDTGTQGQVDVTALSTSTPAAAAFHSSGGSVDRYIVAASSTDDTDTFGINWKLSATDANEEVEFNWNSYPNNPVPILIRRGDTSIHFDNSRNIVQNGSFFGLELSAANVDRSTYGQYWTRNDTPQTPMWTGEDGDDTVIHPGISALNTQNVNYTLVMGDIGKTIHKASGGAGETITIPANASVAFPIGTMISISNEGGGDLSVAITTDTMTGTDGTTGTKTLGNNHVAVIQKMTATTWKYAASDL
jgi:hypothetical protein